MKVLVTHSPWIGGVFVYLSNGFEKNGCQTARVVYKRQKSALRLIKIHNIPQIGTYLERKSWSIYNKQVLTCFKEFCPDLFITMNQSSLLPETVREIQKGKCRTACFVADNPFDSNRFTYFPITLKYFDYLFVADRIWIPSIRNVAPKAKIIKTIGGGGFSKELFFPLDEKMLTENDRERFSCNISFTGESYGLQAEGAYRAGILDQLGSYKLKIWGDERWKIRFPYYDSLERAYQGDRLPFDDLRKLYRLSTINLNMPAPQVLTAFQPRVLEIAACKGFQIVDWREELDELFSDDELVTFRNIPDLLEKVDFFVKNPDKRQPYIDKLYAKVWNHHTWEKRAKEMLDHIIENRP